MQQVLHLDQLLVYGFIRLHHLNKKLKVPTNIIELCLLWYHLDVETNNLEDYRHIIKHMLDIELEREMKRIRAEIKMEKRKKLKKVSGVDLRVYCMCCRPYDSSDNEYDMIQCDYCQQWYYVRDILSSTTNRIKLKCLACTGWHENNNSDDNHKITTDVDIPNNYICVLCNKVGAHWSMDCENFRKNDAEIQNKMK